MLGGRMKFELGQQVRILTLDGKVSAKEYEVEVKTADGKGLVPLTELGTKKSIKVNQRRIIPQVDKGGAIVVESSNKFRAICPTCPIVFDITPDHTSIECPEHGIFNLCWLGEKPVTDTTTTPETPETIADAVETSATTAPPSTTAKPSTTKKEKKARTPIAVDLPALATLEGCELWTKANVSFNHVEITVTAHVLLWVGDEPRKMCFNTYDGTLGKKGKPINVEAFCAFDKENSSHPIYAVKALDKERAKLTNKGYNHQTS